MDYIRDGLLKAFQLILQGDPETYSAIWVTLQVSTCAMTVSLAVGLPLGFVLGHFNFPCKKAVRTIVDTLQALPTVFIGLLVYTLLSRRGPLGELGLLFTLPAIAIGQTILAVPVVAALSATAVESLDQRLRITLLTLGAGPWQLLLTVLREARYGLLAAGVNAYGRVLTEVGISMLVGGNIKWHTRTITTAIALETGKGRFDMGIALGLVLLTLAFGVNLSLFFLRKRVGP